MVRKTMLALGLTATVITPLSAFAQGSAGTGSTSTGIGTPTGVPGPGIRTKGETMQPGTATNGSTTNSNLSPSQKNSVPPMNAPQFEKNTKGYQR
jgi:hypothetical protein